MAPVAVAAVIPWMLMLFVQIKRAHDLGMPAIVVTPMFVSFPFLFITAVFPASHDALEMWTFTASGIVKYANIGMGTYFLLAPGEKGRNTYGPDPLDIH